MRRWLKKTFIRLTTLLAAGRSADGTEEPANRRKDDGVEQVLSRSPLVGPGVLLLVEPAHSTLNDSSGSTRLEVSELLTKAIRQGIREEDQLVHLRDGSFVILLVGAPPSEAEQIAERICNSVANTIVVGQPLSITSGAVFVGGAAVMARVEASELLRARQSLAESKRQGPNTYCIAA